MSRSRHRDSSSSERLKVPEKLKVVDTYIHALERLAAIAPEVTEIEEEVAGREQKVLERVLEQAKPIMGRMSKEIVLKEPWSNGSRAGEEKKLRQKGLLLTRSFHSERKEDGTNVYTSQGLILTEQGRLIEVHESARWAEPDRKHSTWQIELSEAENTKEFAAKNLAPILTKLLDVLRETLEKAVDDKKELKDRLGRLYDAEKALGSD